MSKNLVIQMDFFTFCYILWGRNVKVQENILDNWKNGRVFHHAVTTTPHKDRAPAPALH